MQKQNIFLSIAFVMVVGWLTLEIPFTLAQTCGDGGVCGMIAECPSSNFAADPVCTDNTVCCLPASSGGGTCTGSCHQVSRGCTAPEVPDNTESCSNGQVCCKMPSAGGQNECQIGGGTCRSASSCVAPETLSVRSCDVGSNQICCDMPNGGRGEGEGGVTGSKCTDSKIGGVCFPSGTGLSEKSIVEILTSFISWILGIFGFIAILGFIISGLQYIFATGDEGMVETAKRNMKYSIIGVIVALSGWIVIKAVDTLLSASPLI